MKVLILTQINLSDEEKELIINSDHICRIALNHHAKELRPHLRFTADYVAEKLKKIDNLDVYSSRDSKGILVDVEHSGSSLADCCDWLQGWNEILLVADNTIHTKEFQNNIKEHLRDKKGIYKFTENGNFDLPYINLKDFINGNY